MKIAINRCFGGFGISGAAFEKLLERKGIAFEKMPSQHRWLGVYQFDYWKTGMVDNDDGYLSEHGFCADRSDPDLIAVIEEMGKESEGWVSDIVIVEVPDDVKWHIHEYDGLEHVAEDHRTWSGND